MATRRKPAGSRLDARSVAVLLVAGIAAYANGLAAPFVLDDQVAIVDNLSIRSLWNADIFRPEGGGVAVAGRPLVNASLALNYAFGGTSVTGYHVVNLAIHLMCGVVAFALIRLSCRMARSSPVAVTHDHAIAVAAALLWLVHPLNTEAVMYVTQRTESMMALCYLLTMYASARALPDLGIRDQTSRIARRWAAIAVVACALGMACKESMVTAPVMVVLFDRVFAFSSWREALRRRRRLYAGLCASWVVLAALAWSGPRGASAGFGTEVGVWTYLLNQAVMITRYLWLAVWPRPLVVNYGWPVPLSLGDVLPQAALVVTLLAVAVAAFRYRPRLTFLGAWFFITLAPTSSFVPIATEVGAERRMYLPLLAITTGAVVAAVVLGQTVRARRLGPTVLACAVALLAWSTHTRTAEYASPMRLAETVLERWPSAAAHAMVGEQALRLGRRAEAIGHLRQAAAGAPRAHYALGLVYYDDGDLDKAIQELSTFIRERPLMLEVPNAHVFMAQAYARRQQWGRAEAEARLSLAKAPANDDARGVLADALFKQQRYDEAIVIYREFTSRRPTNAAAFANLAIALSATDRPREAVAMFRRAAELEPRNGSARQNLAIAYDVLGQALARQGQFAAAVQAFEQAVALAPEDPELRQHLLQVRRTLPR